MKNLNLTTLVVVIVFIATFFTSGGSASKPKQFIIDKSRSEGYVAFIVNEKVLDQEEESEIECDGSGWITHGDGHKTKCGGCNACVNSQDRTKQSEEYKKKATIPPHKHQTFRRRGILQRIFQ